MPYDPQKHHRRSIRMSDYDYRGEGAYFITIWTKRRLCAFGSVRNDVVSLSRRGMVAQHCWQDIPNHRPNVELDQLIIMPNHVHGILWIVSQNEQRATQVSPLQAPSTLLAGSLGAIVGSYKAAVSREINKLRPGAGKDLWQANYFEHIVRTQRALEAIREYIFTNPQRWDRDRENPDGDGTDDFESFVRSLEIAVKQKEGDTSVAPTLQP